MTTRSYRILRWWALAELGLTCCFLALIVFLIMYQILVRSFFGEPLVWAEELGMILFIWIVLIGAAAAAKMDRHVTVEALENLVGPNGMHLLMQFGRLLTVVVMLIIAYLINPYISIESRTTTVSLPVHIPRSFIFSIPLTYACVSIAGSSALLFFLQRGKSTGSPGAEIARELLQDEFDSAGKM